MNEITIQVREFQPALIADVDELAAIGASLVVGSQAQYQGASELLKRIKGARNRIDAERKEMTKPIDALKASVMERAKPYLEKLDHSESRLKKALGAYLDEQERIRAEAERKAAEAARKERERLEMEAAKAAEAARREREQAEAKARELEDKGRTELAEARRAAAAERERQKLAAAQEAQAAAAAIPAAPVVHIEAAKVSGQSSSQIWKYEITDPAALPREYLAPDDKLIAGTVRLRKEHTNIPGVRVYSERVISSRSA
ncbi:MAG: hypothetical protein AB7Q97_01855 [Gammaproteobacteria bacterium]